MNLRSLSLVIPTLLRIFFWTIQADQSRQQKYREALDFIKKFQSYQFRQINPDNAAEHSTVKKVFGFQSYQFRQINPDYVIAILHSFFVYCFNRINSGRSIPTIKEEEKEEENGIVSIVSIQADQSRLGNYLINRSWLYVRFNRINSGRSIPTCCQPVLY